MRIRLRRRRRSSLRAGASAVLPWTSARPFRHGSRAPILAGSLAIGLVISVAILDLAGIAPLDLAGELAGVFNADSLRSVLVRAAPLILVGLGAGLAFSHRVLEPSAWKAR